MNGFVRTSVLFVALVIFAFPATVHADSFSFTANFNSGVLNPNLSTNATPGFGVSLSGAVATLSQSPGTGSGFASIYTNFQIDGDFTVTVMGNRTFNTTGSTGLEVFSYPNFSDIYFFGPSTILGNVYPNCCASASDTNSTVAFRLMRTGGTLYQQYDSGNGWVTLRADSGIAVSGPQGIAIFLTQEVGATNFNQVSFDNLNIQADRVTGYANPVPEPSSVVLILSEAVGLALRRLRFSR